MSTKLFKNTDGKVLMSVGNKLIKQTHEFRLAFQNRIGKYNNRPTEPNYIEFWLFYDYFG